MPIKDYRIFINDYFEKKKKLNANYSMRAFARDLGLSASTLNEILNLHHSISIRSAEKVLTKLKLSSEYEAVFRRLVSEELSKRKTARSLQSKGLTKVRVRSEDIEQLEEEIRLFLSSFTERFHTPGSKNEAVIKYVFNKLETRPKKSESI